MGLTAFVAVEQSGQKYDVYHSANGGRDYLLRPILQNHFENKDLSSIDRFSNLSPDSVRKYLPETYSVSHDDEEPLVTQDPVVKGITGEELGISFPWYDTEILYVVSESGVDTLIPVVLTARAMYTLFSTAQLEFYHPSRDFQEVIQSMQKGGRPDVVFDGTPVTPSELSSQPPWTKKTLEQGHRYLLHKCHQLQQAPQLSRTQLFLETGAVEIKLQSPGNVPFVPVAFIRVPWTDNGPKYPIATGENGNLGPEPKVITSKLRYNYYDETYPVINSSTTDDASVAVNIPNAPLMAKSLNERFEDDFDWQFVSDEFEALVKAEL